MRVECEICGAYTEDPEAIEQAKRVRICPGCGHIGSLHIANEEEEGTYVIVDTEFGDAIGVFNDRKLAEDGLRDRIDAELERMFSVDSADSGLVREWDEPRIREELNNTFKIKKFNAINVIELN